MNLTAERNHVAQILSDGGVRALPHVPSSPTPPLAMVVPGSPYLSAPTTYGGARTLRFDVWLVLGQTADNAKLADALDQRIEEAIAILEADNWLIEDVQVDQWAPASGGPYQVAIIGIRFDINP